MNTLKYIWGLGLWLCLLLPIYSRAANITFIENQRQWSPQVAFAADLSGAKLYLEKDRLTYYLREKRESEDNCNDSEHTCHQPPGSRSHAYQMIFEGASEQCRPIGQEKISRYYNYYLGNDKSKWAAEVPAYQSIVYPELYDCIDLIAYSDQGNFKYDLELKSGADISQLSFRYEGLDDIQLINGKLQLSTSLGEIYESQPIAYQRINGKRKTVECAYRLDGKLMRFELGDYNAALPLTIDPTVVFATFSGSSADNWGSTATYDSEGNAFGAGVVFSSGYPSTIGAFQTSFAGGFTDIAITKFSTDGVTAVYSTYIGGSGSEFPHSLVADSNDNLILFGTSGSNNYPVTANAFQSSFQGGTFSYINGGSYDNGVDIILSKFSFDGIQLLGSTYLGGSGNDGVNDADYQLKPNYGDEARGEVIVEEDGSILIASSSMSTDFPVTAGVVQSNNAGGQDAVIVKLHSDLSNIYWSTYYGGASNDAAYSLKKHSTNGDYYFAGGTLGDMNLSGGLITSPIAPGLGDAYIVRLSSNATSATGTYLGTSEYDQAYFVEVNQSGDVYTFGQTNGSYPVTDDVWSQAGQKQFVHALSPDLNSTIFSTVFGVNNLINMSPTAFLVDECDRIYVAGWGGSLNSWQFGDVAGLYTSPDAYDSNSDGNDFYFMVLDANASSVLYATFFGGSNNEHVDGGTSRFDKRGVIYQAICACGQGSPTTPGVVSPGNGAGGCNLYLVKLDMEQSIPTANAAASPGAIGCADPVFTVQFQNQSFGASEYLWDLGNGQTFEGETPPPIIYTDPGVYDIQLIAFSPEQCQTSDTLFTEIIVESPIEMSAVIDYENPVECTSLEYGFSSQNSILPPLPAEELTYYWDFGDGGYSYEANPIHQFSAEGQYTITLSIMAQTGQQACSNVTAEELVLEIAAGVDVAANLPDISNGCLPYLLELTAPADGSQITWSLDGEVIGSEPQLSYSLEQPGMHLLELIVANPNSCNLADTAAMEFQGFPIPEAQSLDFNICQGESFILPNNQAVVEAGSYPFTYLNNNNCDSLVTYEIIVDLLSESSQTAEICPGDTFQLPDGGTVSIPGTYTSTLTASNQCDSLVYTSIEELSEIQVNQAVQICPGESYYLEDGTELTEAGTYSNTFLSSSGCDSTVYTILSMLTTSQTTIAEAFCEGGSLTLPDGTSVNEAGEYELIYTNMSGCDSTVRHVVSVLPTYDEEIAVDICQGESYTLPDGQSVNVAGEYPLMFSSVFGCDSLVSMTISVKETYISEQSASLCVGEAFLLPDGATAFQTDTYETVLTSQLACDSTVYTYLNFIEPQESVVQLEICEGANYILPDGTQAQLAGTYPVLLTSSEGCDSLVNFQLTVVATIYYNDEIAICSGESYTFADGSSTDQAGVYNFEAISFSGCDSLASITLNLLPVYEEEESRTICAGESSILPTGEIVNETGLYPVLLTSSLGCDSLVNFDLMVLENSSSSMDVDICQGQSYELLDGSSVDLAGSYPVILPSANGCDSTLMTNLNLLPVYDLQIPTQICEGTSYMLPDGTEVSEEGSYFFALQSVSQCDSLLTFSITMVENVSLTEEVFLCQGESYELADGTSVDTSGEYLTSLASAEGCDSLITTYFTLLVQDSLAIDQTICQGEQFALPNGELVDGSGEYPVSLQNVNGCDSIVTTSLLVLPSYEEDIDVNICEGQLHTLPDGASVSVADTYPVLLSTMDACDSLIITNLQVWEVFSDTLSAEICPGATYELGEGTLVSEPGIYTIELISSMACDSTIFVDLSLSDPITSSQEIELCPGDSFELPDGQVITEAQVFDLSLSTATGCDSLVNIDLTYSSIGSGYVQQSACLGEEITLPDGSLIQESGTFDFYFQTAEGCDSLLQFEAKFELCDQYAIMPNAFSPNGDGVNDELRLLTSLQPVNYELRVFDRWGKQLFYTANPEQAWDGDYKGEVCEMGVYVFFFSFDYENQGTVQQIFGKGNVTLLR